MQNISELAKINAKKSCKTFENASNRKMYEFTIDWKIKWNGAKMSCLRSHRIKRIPSCQTNCYSKFTLPWCVNVCDNRSVSIYLISSTYSQRGRFIGWAAACTLEQWEVFHVNDKYVSVKYLCYSDLYRWKWDAF